MNIKYLLLRAIRHRLPENLARTLLRKGIIIRPGLETREPAQAVARYSAYFGELLKSSMCLSLAMAAAWRWRWNCCGLAASM